MPMGVARGPDGHEPGHPPVGEAHCLVKPDGADVVDRGVEHRHLAPGHHPRYHHPDQMLSQALAPVVRMGGPPSRGSMSTGRNVFYRLADGSASGEAAPQPTSVIHKGLAASP